MMNQRKLLNKVRWADYFLSHIELGVKNENSKKRFGRLKKRKKYENIKWRYGSLKY